MKNEVIYVGWINRGKPADCGETMKNQICIQRLEELGVRCRQMDFKNWKKHPQILLQLAWNMLVHTDNTLIMSTSPKNVYPLMKIMRLLHWKQNTVHWVIGGSFGSKVQEGIYKAEIVRCASHTLVESDAMVEQLKNCGLEHVKKVPNFKKIPAIPKVHNSGNTVGEPIRFVFLSRIMPEKGCDYILQAAELLNEEGYSHRFVVDFYGKVAEDYKEIFEAKVAELPNVHYKGFLNLFSDTGYQNLSSYDAMLFPTYWKGEGFAGVLVDAFIAGLPVIATDWAHNRAFLEEGRTGIFLPVHDIPALKEKMKACIDGKYDLESMSRQCRLEAAGYDVDRVIDESLLKEIGVMN